MRLPSSGHETRIVWARCRQMPWLARHVTTALRPSRSSTRDACLPATPPGPGPQESCLAAPAPANALKTCPSKAPTPNRQGYGVCVQIVRCRDAAQVSEVSSGRCIAGDQVGTWVLVPGSLRDVWAGILAITLGTLLLTTLCSYSSVTQEHLTRLAEQRRNCVNWSPRKRKHTRSSRHGGCPLLRNAIPHAPLLPLARTLPPCSHSPARSPLAPALPHARAAVFTAPVTALVASKPTETLPPSPCRRHDGRRAVPRPSSQPHNKQQTA